MIAKPQCTATSNTVVYCASKKNKKRTHEDDPWWQFHKAHTLPGLSN